MNGLYLQQLKAFEANTQWKHFNCCRHSSLRIAVRYFCHWKELLNGSWNVCWIQFSVSWLVLMKTTHDYCTVGLSCAHTWVKPFRYPILRGVSTHRQIFRRNITDVNHEPWSQLFHSLIEPKVVLFLIVSIHEQWDCVCSPHVPPGTKVKSTHTCIMLRNRSLGSYLNR